MRDPRERGVTLIEVVAAIAVIAIAASIAIGAIGHALPSAVGFRIPVTAREVARDLFEEVVSKPFKDPDGTDGETSRTAFDDVDDYDGYTDSPPTTPTGEAIPGAGALTRAVRVKPVDSNLVEVTGPANLLRVEVDATWSGGKVTLTGLKANPTSVVPPPRSLLHYISGTRTDRGQEHMAFRIRNRSNAALTVQAVKAFWDGREMYFKELKADGPGVRVDIVRVPLFAEGERIPISPPMVLRAKSEYEIELRHFRLLQDGTGPKPGDALLVAIFTVVFETDKGDLQAEVEDGSQDR